MTNQDTIYPDCMQGPSEPCAGYAQLLNHAEVHRREAERLRTALERIGYPERGMRPADQKEFLKGYAPEHVRIAQEALSASQGETKSPAIVALREALSTLREVKAALRNVVMTVPYECVKTNVSYAVALLEQEIGHGHEPFARLDEKG